MQKLYLLVVTRGCTVARYWCPRLVGVGVNFPRSDGVEMAQERGSRGETFQKLGWREMSQE